jgi:hypothetical protein
VLAFESRKLAPIATGSDLLTLVCSLMDTLDWEFRKADMSDRAVVETAKDEESVQEWLGTTLVRMGGGRFRCDRETQVAANRRPDITVTATQVPVQIAIEIKHDEKGWTMPNLRFALATQLSERYLYPANRRHGVLVITNHRDAKFWRERRSGERILFGEAIEKLQAQAARISSNSTGPIEVAVRGLDASPGRRQVAKAKNARRSTATKKFEAAPKAGKAVAKPAAKKPPASWRLHSGMGVDARRSAVSWSASSYCSMWSIRANSEEKPGDVPVWRGPMASSQDRLDYVFAHLAGVALVVKAADRAHRDIVECPDDAVVDGGRRA